MALLIILPGISAEEVTVDLGNLYISNPKITLEFTAPARLESYRLTDIEGRRTYTLCVRPSPSPTVYEQTYEMYTTTATDADCAEGQSQYLIPGDYLFMVQASDAKAQVTKLYQYPFRTFGLEAVLVSPLSNVSASRPADVVFTTTKIDPVRIGDASADVEGLREPVDAICRYALSLTKTWEATRFSDLKSPVDAEARSTHVLNVDPQGELYIICKESDVAGREAKLHLSLGYDLTAPKFMSVTRTPERVTSLTGLIGYSKVKVVTDDKSACNITGPHNSLAFFGEDINDFRTYNTTHEVELEFDPQLVGMLPKNLTYAVSCTNLAGRENMTRFNITVDYRNALSVQVLEPPAITNQTSFELIVRPQLIADPGEKVDECYVNDDGKKDAAHRMAPKSYPDGASGTITVFSMPFAYRAEGLDDGSKTYKITCYDTDAVHLVYTTILDSTPPAIPEVNASQFICDSSVSARFNSTDKTTGVISYNYTLSDDGGIIASNTTAAGAASVRLSRTVRGTMKWQVAATDAAGNTGGQNTTAIDGLRQGEDEECGLPAFITLMEPGRGMAQSIPYDLIIGTQRASVCRYSFSADMQWQSMTPFTTKNHLLHAQEDFNRRFDQKQPKTVYIACNETGNGQLHRKQFLIGVDPSDPKVTVSGAPNPVVDRSRRVVTIIAKSDDRTYCVIDGDASTIVDRAFGASDPLEQQSYTAEHRTTLDFRGIDDDDIHEFDYEVTCTNLAFGETIMPYSVVVDLGADFTIKILSPPAFTRDDDITLAVQPSREAACTYDNNGTDELLSEANGTHSVHIGTMTEGGHSIKIMCTSSDLEASTVAQFTIDKSVPVIGDLRGPATVCQGSPARYLYNVTSLDEDITIAYTVRSLDASADYNTTDAVISIDSSKLEPGEYTLLVKATNSANVSSEAQTADFTVLAKDSEACLVPADHCTNAKLDPGEDAVDCGGTCEACTKCADDLGCDLGEWCHDGVCEPTTLECSDDLQCKPGICDAGKCVPKPGCASDAECDGGTCVSGVCQSAGCETDYDCPGQKCSDGVCVDVGPSPEPACYSDDECDGGTCVDGVCAAPEEGGHLLSILLIVLGLATMGGAGYVLYERNAAKAAQSASQSSTPSSMPRAPGALSPQMNARYEQNKAGRQAALDGEYARRQEEHAKRESTFQSFGTAAPAAVKDAGASGAKPSDAKPGAKQDAKSDDDGYVDLGAIKKKPKDEKDGKKDDKRAAKPAEGDDAFDQLGKI